MCKEESYANTVCRDLLGDYVPADPDLIIAEAKRRIAAKFRRGAALTSPNAARDAVQLHLAEYDHEVFAGFFLDNQHRIIEFSVLAEGTIDAAAVYPREVIKKALDCQAAAVIFCHNHPSGFAEPSQADKALIMRLKNALSLLDIRVLDHFIVGADEVYSFAEHRLL
ncbi:RadC family protein [Methylocaldum szegediense]|uniref:RadC family protein n=1 Tax=Methylocaldum szegediense TaxID=73780 RepID=UPI00047D3529|nr:DNA repair protein RadC [Methylocaldum szegediense]